MEPQEDINLLEPKSLDGLVEKPKSKKKFWLFFIILALLGIAGCIFRQNTLSMWPDDPTTYDLKTLQPKKISIFQTVKNFVFHSDNVLAGQSDDRVNILLLGIGGPGHDGAFLSDTNIIVSIKPSTKQVAIISIPRDLAVKINEHGVRKINSADAYGEVDSPGNGGEYARQIFSQIFDMDIPYYFRVDFTAFSDIIDQVGGVTVNVDRPFVDNEFPGPNYSYRQVAFEAGTQTLSGQRALDYARSRHGNNGEGSDFARAYRQQKMLSVLKEKLLSFGTYTNPVKVQQIIQTLNQHIATNINFGQLMYLTGMAKDADGNIKMLVLDDSPNGYLRPFFSDNGAAMLAPKTSNFIDINSAIKNIFEMNLLTATSTTKYPPLSYYLNSATSTKTATTTTSTNPIFHSGKIEIQNGTWRVGLAAKYQKLLQDKGVTVLPPSNCYKRPIDTTAIYLINPSVDQEIISAVQDIFHIQAQEDIPKWLTENFDDPATVQDDTGLKFQKESDILIILGNDLTNA